MNSILVDGCKLAREIFENVSLCIVQSDFVTVTDLRRNMEVLKYYKYKAAYDDTEHLEM